MSVPCLRQCSAGQEILDDGWNTPAPLHSTSHPRGGAPRHPRSFQAHRRHLRSEIGTLSRVGVFALPLSIPPLNGMFFSLTLNCVLIGIIGLRDYETDAMEKGCGNWGHGGEGGEQGGDDFL